MFLWRWMDGCRISRALKYAYLLKYMKIMVLFHFHFYGRMYFIKEKFLRFFSTDPNELLKKEAAGESSAETGSAQGVKGVSSRAVLALSCPPRALVPPRRAFSLDRTSQARSLIVSFSFSRIFSSDNPIIVSPKRRDSVSG